MKVGNAEVQLVLDKAKFMRALTMVKAKVKMFAMKARMQMHRLGTAVSAVASKFKLLLVAGIAAAGIAIWKAISTFAKFEKQMASISTMLDETSKKFLPSYAAGMRRLSIAVGESTETLAKGLYNILSATIPANKAMKVLELASKGAAGGMTTTDVAVTALTKAMLQYKKLSPEKIMDTLAAAVERGYFTFEQLAGAMPGVLQLGKSSNVAFGELSGTMAFLSKRFATVAEAGTALEGLLKAIKIPTGRYKDALETMGIAAKDVQDRIGKEGLQKGLRWLIDKAESVGLSVDTMFRRKEAMLAITAMSQGMEDWKTDIDIVSSSTGAMQRKFEDMQKTLTFQTNRLKQGFTDAFRVMGTQLAPVVKKLVDDLIKKLPDIVEFGRKVGIELAGWYYWITKSAKSGALKYIWDALGYIYDKVKNVIFNFKALGIYLTGEFAIAMKKQSIRNMENASKNMLLNREQRDSLKERVKEAKKELSELRDKQIGDLEEVKAKHDEFKEFFIDHQEGKKFSAQEFLDFVKGLRTQDDEEEKASLDARIMSFETYMQNLRDAKRTGFEKDEELIGRKLTLQEKYLIKMFKSEKTTMDYIMEIHSAVFGALSAGFENAFKNIGKKGYQFKDFLGSIWKSIYDSFAKMIAKMIAKWLTLKIMKGIFGLGVFQKGINYVPFDMLAMVHKGEKITPASRNQPPSYDVGGIKIELNVGSMTSEDVEPIAEKLVEAIKNRMPGAMGLSKEIYQVGGELSMEA